MDEVGELDEVDEVDNLDNVNNVDTGQGGCGLDCLQWRRETGVEKCIFFCRR